MPEEKVYNEINSYKLFWIFTIGSIIGYIVETIFCFLKYGFFESRQGLLYGPFCQIYGFGAVIMVVCLLPLSKKNNCWILLGSALIGGVFEWLCSYAQEFALGTVSWHYSGSTLPLGNGRTSLTYMFFWAVLGLLFIKFLYPKLSELIDRIPARLGQIAKSFLTAFLVFDMAISFIAVYRWTERLNDIAPSNQIESRLDEWYPNSYMKEIYPNMRITTNNLRSGN